MPARRFILKWDLKGLSDYLADIFQISVNFDSDRLEEMSREDVKEALIKRAHEAYEKKEEELGGETLRDLERYIMLKTVDQKWMDHIDAMAQLREGIGLRAYGQRDPVIEYKFEGYEMFQDMVKSIQEDTLRYLFRVRVKVAPEERQQKTYNVSYSHNEDAKPQPIKNKEK